MSLFSIYDEAVCTVQPEGIPLSPDTFHVAALFLTNVPDDATLYTHWFVYEVEGYVVNIAFI